jgi:KDO2-lipid IV(A) lauroyltransferase
MAPTLLPPDAAHGAPQPTAPPAGQGRSVISPGVLRLADGLLHGLGPRRVWCIARCLALPIGLLLPSLRRPCERIHRHADPTADGLTIALRAIRHLADFAAVLCDRRLLALRPERFHLRGRGADRLAEACRRPGGAVLVGAHCGAWEISSRFLSRWVRDLAIVKLTAEDPEERRHVDTALARVGPAPQVIDPRDGLDAVLAARAALARGAVVGLLGDRALPGQAWRAALLLGRPAALPVGPAQLAVASGAPLLLTLLLRLRPGCYALLVDGPWQAPVERRQRAQAVAMLHGAWAAAFDAVLRRHAGQWNCWYDPWSQPEPQRRRTQR